jgi:kelch-like protein 10
LLILVKMQSQYNLRPKLVRKCRKNCICNFPTEEKIDKNLDRLRRDNFFLDMEMVGHNSRYDTRKFKAHKVVIQSRLGPRLAHDSYLTDDGTLTVDMGVPGHILEDLISMAYTGAINIDHSNIRHHMNISKKFEIKCIKKLVIDYLVTSLSLDNALCNYRLAKEVACPGKLDLIRAYILKHVLAMDEQGNDFTDSQLEDLVNFITDDRLFATEEELFQLVAKWLKMGFTERRALLNHIRYSKMSLKFITDTVEPSLPSPVNKFLASVIKNAKDHHSTGGKKVKNLEDFRLPPDIILALGGWRSDASNGPTTQIDALNLRSGTWNTMEPTMTFSRAYAGAGIMENKVYIIGGYDGEPGRNGYLDTNLCFDSEIQEWSMVQPMNQPRCYLSTATFGGYIYAIGGMDGQTRLNTVERYDPKTNIWTNMPPMTQARSDGCAVAYNGNVWVLGGFNGVDIHDSVEIFNPNIMEWTNGPSMLTPRSGVKAITHEGKIYVIGGFDGVTRLKTVECLDLTNGGRHQWQFVNDLLLQRSNFAVTKMLGKILVLGGFEGAGVTDKTEIYDSITDTWSSYTPMKIKRSALLAVTLKIKDFDNFHPYPKSLLGKR